MSSESRARRVQDRIRRSRQIATAGTGASPTASCRRQPSSAAPTGSSPAYSWWTSSCTTSTPASVLSLTSPTATPRTGRHTGSAARSGPKPHHRRTEQPAAGAGHRHRAAGRGHPLQQARSRSRRKSGPCSDEHGPQCPNLKMRDQWVLTAVSSTTNEVCREASSVPVNLMVTAVPAAEAPSGTVCWV
jgi:hypothetical protein